MDLKELLGEELYKQVKEKAGDHKLAVINDGNWIPKEKFDDLNTEKNDLKDRIKERDTQLNDLKEKAKDSEELSQQITDLQEKNDQDAQAFQKKLESQAKDSAIELALRDAKAKNPKIAKNALDMETITLKDGKLIGIDEQLKVIQESDAYLFGEDKPKGLQGREPHSTDPNNTAPSKNPFSKEHFNLTEQGRLLREEPELAKQLQGQA